MHRQDIKSFVASATGSRKESLDLSGGEGFGFLPIAAAARTLADCNVAGDQVVPHGLRERHLEGSMDVVNGAGGEGLALLVVEPPNLNSGKVLELAVTKCGLEVIVHYALGADVGAVGHFARRHERFETVAEPRVHPLPGLEIVRVE